MASHREGSPCVTSFPKDATVAECQPFCSFAEASHHCPWCKCKACAFCTPTSEITHIYASAGVRMVACTEGTSVPYQNPRGGTTLQQCKEACDAASATCRSFSYSGALKSCKLWRSGGEPLSFCDRQDWSTYWRVEIPMRSVSGGGSGGSSSSSSSSSSAAAPPPAAALLGPIGLPRRAIVQGQQLVDSASGAALQLHGLNIYLDYVHYDDMALMRQLLPSANLVRLVGIFWHDAERLADCTCCTDDITQVRHLRRRVTPSAAECLSGCLSGYLSRDSIECRGTDGTCRRAILHRAASRNC